MIQMRMISIFRQTLFLILATAFLDSATAKQTVGLVPASLVDHPVASPATSRTSSAWRRNAGAWGESLADQTLRLRGFKEVHEIKNGANNGIDRLAIKRRPDGTMQDLRLLEVKTTRSSKVKLGNTNYGGRQMSPGWLAKNLNDLHRSGNPALTTLAAEIDRFQRESGKPLEAFGEVMHINTHTGLLTAYTADGVSVKYQLSARRLLAQIQKRMRSPETSRWTASSLSQWNQIQSTRMSSWLANAGPQQRRSEVIATTIRSANRTLLRQSQSLVARRILGRAAGPIGAVIAFGFDAKELYDVEYAYRQGAISLRQRNIRLATTGGGMAGAFAGASAGGVAGAWVGAFGGPFAWITVPVGGAMGGTIGGIGGYYSGSAAAKYAASAWYESIDGGVRERFERDWLETSFIAN